MSLHDEYKPTSAPPVEKPQYLFVLIIMATVVLASIVTLEVLTAETKDNSVTIGLILGFGVTITTGILTYQKAEQAKSQSVETHIMVNSRLSEWMLEAKASSKAEGEIIGRKQANERTDMLAKGQSHEGET
jgi:xanthine/uracil permease